MSFNYSPNIITDGLIFYVDASNTKSYPRTGVTWFDISKNGNNSTLINGTTFDSDNGGNIIFDGTNDYMTLDTPIINNIYSLDFWYKMSGNDGTYGYFTSTSNKGLAISEGGTASSLIYGQFYYYNGSNIIKLGNIPSTTKWNHICVVINTTSNNIKLYGDGNQLSDTTVSSMTTTTTDIGRYVQGNSNFLYGSIASYKIYDRALTPNEVKQNYNAMKSRFEI